jgi:hypothetical protein
MGTKGREVPRVVCCAIPLASTSGKVLVITSRKRQDLWVLPKGGWELSDVTLERAASREALEEGLNLCPSSVCSSPDGHPMLFFSKNITASKIQRAFEAT